MFSFLKATPHTDPSLGVLVRSRGHWRGTLALRHGQPVPLAIAGSRIAPDPDALALAPEQVQELKTRVLVQRAARTFAIDRGDFTIDEAITIPLMIGIATPSPATVSGSPRRAGCLATSSPSSRSPSRSR